jgi:hypothetical protein
MGAAKPPDRHGQEHSMTTNQDLIGKTITGVIAVTPPGEETREIWMLQFSDGSHVEFVSPTGKRRLRRNSVRRRSALPARRGSPQLALNVA